MKTRLGSDPLFVSIFLVGIDTYIDRYIDRKRAAHVSSERKTVGGLMFVQASKQ